MEGIESTSTQAVDADNSSAKRKRSPSTDAPTHPAVPAKVAKTHSNHLQINYLSRQFSENLPLISGDDTLPSILSLIGDYDGVLQRHESMASNLGARPLGPILIKRFERLFEGLPRVLKTHGKEGTVVTWLDVVEFARNKPEQFNLEKMRDGVRVCQFYTKQSRVEISEEDYVLIASGMPQKLIPPQPIGEDEEKELGTLEILERNIAQVIQITDQVSARARQLTHRLKNRKNAIISRREAEASASIEDQVISPHSSAPNSALPDRGSASFQSNGDQRASQSPTSGFVAVNSKLQGPNDKGGLQNGNSQLPEHTRSSSKSYALHGASPATRAELMKNFFTNSERAYANEVETARRASLQPSRPLVPPKAKTKTSYDNADYASILLNSASPVPIPNTPSSLLPYNKPAPVIDRFDDSGPYKAEMVARMEQLQRGDRILPPCDRCRRLHMDCLKNLTACMGCTKKHAKCSWKDVRDDELRDNPLPDLGDRDEVLDDYGARDNYASSNMGIDDTAHRYHSHDLHSQHAVRDEELLGEDDSDEEADQLPIQASTETAATHGTPLPQEKQSSESTTKESVYTDGHVNQSLTNGTVNENETTPNGATSARTESHEIETSSAAMQPGDDLSKRNEPIEATSKAPPTPDTPLDALTNDTLPKALKDGPAETAKMW